MRDWSVPVTGRVVFMSFARGDDFLEGIGSALARAGVQGGVILSAVATFERCRLHQVQSRDDVNDQRVVELAGPVELASATGIVANGEAHVHATVADREGRAYGGHLEPGCPILYLGEVSVLAVDAPDMRRLPADDGVAHLRG